MTTLISEEMKGIIGKELVSKRSYPITQSDIRKWAIAVYFPDQPPAEFLDDPQVAPEEFNPFAWATPTPAVRFSEMGATALEDVAGIPAPPVKFQLNGGVGCTYGVRMRPGDVITSSLSIVNYFEKSGKLGQMLFTDRADVWTNQNGEVVRTNTSTLIRY